MKNNDPFAQEPEQDNDDATVGRILSRRELLTLFGIAGTATLAGAIQAFAAESTTYLPLASRPIGETIPSNTATATPIATGTPVPTATASSAATATNTPIATATTSGTATATPIPACVVRPAKTEGPYFVDEMLNRSDIRSDPSTGTVKTGKRLDLTVVVSKISGSSCATLQSAQVDIWHCDAGGLYSDVSQNGTVGQKFLRGYQLTNASGVAQFTTIYPGWYSGRTAHIHFMICATTSTGSTYNFTSQFFFDDTLSDQIYAVAPYNIRGTRDTRNNNDNVYGNNGAQLLLTLTQTTEGYSATFDIGLSFT